MAPAPALERLQASGECETVLCVYNLSVAAIAGEYCTQSSGCSGIVYGGGSECCVGVLTTNAGGVETCCSGPHAVVDSTGTCCVSGQLDARGM